MTVVYTLGSGSNWHNNELRYSLRSFEQYLVPERVIVIGYKPEWYTGEHIPAKDGVRKAYNIHMKTLAACDQADWFIQAADDHYLLAPWNDFTPRYSGLLKDKKHTGYYGMLTEATARLIPGGKFFNLHIPLLIDAEGYKRTVGALDWNENEYLIKSAYCNLMGLEGREDRDCKVVGHMRTDDIERYVKGRAFLSSGNPVPLDLKRWLAARFPNKSKWEI